MIDQKCMSGKFISRVVLVQTYNIGEEITFDVKPDLKTYMLEEISRLWRLKLVKLKKGCVLTKEVGKVFLRKKREMRGKRGAK